MAERTDRSRLITALFCGAMLFGLALSGAPALAGDADRLYSYPTWDDVSTGNTENFLNSVEDHFSSAMMKNLQGRNLVMAIFLSDYSSGRLIYSDDPWLADEVEYQGKLMAREAIFEGVARTINGVQPLRRIRDYGRSLSTADVTVREGKVNFSGPSLDPSAGSAENADDSDTEFHSRLRLEGGVDLGMSWRTTFGPFEYRLTYFLVGGDVFGMSLEDHLTDWARLALNYRSGIDDQRAIATVRFALP